MASCGFAHLSRGSCGSSADNLANVQCVVVGSCAKSTQGHLQISCIWRLCSAGKRVHITCVAVSLVLWAKRKVILAAFLWDDLEQDQWSKIFLDHGASKELANTLWSWIHRFFGCTMIQTDLGSPILIQITPGERTLWSLEISVIICPLNLQLQWESHTGPHLAIGGRGYWLWYTCFFILVLVIFWGPYD